MKIISIGSSKGCNIHIDSNDISKRHALIYITSTGKMQLVDTSENGTFVNGVRVKSHIMMPVHRKDKVVFANGYQMDWKKVPNPSVKIRMTVLCVCATLCVLIMVYYVIQSNDNPIKNPLVTSVFENNLPQIRENAKIKTDGKKSLQKNKDSALIPSAEELWVGSGKRMPVNKKKKHSSTIEKKNNVEIINAASSQYSDTIDIEEPSLDLEIVEIESEDGYTE